MCLAGAPVRGRSTGPQAHELAAAFLLLPPSCLTVLPSASGWTGRGRRGKGCAFQSCAGGDRRQVACPRGVWLRSGPRAAAMQSELGGAPRKVGAPGLRPPSVPRFYEHLCGIWYHWHLWSSGYDVSLTR